MSEQYACVKVRSKLKVSLVIDPDYVDDTPCSPVDSRPVRGTIVQAAVMAATDEEPSNAASAFATLFDVDCRPN
eukprot:1378000-Amphidinium_carterae.1